MCRTSHQFYKYSSLVLVAVLDAFKNCSLSNMFAKVFTSQLLNSMDLITLPVHVFIIFWASKPWCYFHHCCISDDWETWEQINQKLISWRHSLEARGGSWDSFGLFLVLARDLCHCTSAQLSCSLFVLFCIVSFPMVMFSYVFRFEWPYFGIWLMFLGCLPYFLWN